MAKTSKRRNALGRGLGALLDDSPAPSKGIVPETENAAGSINEIALKEIEVATLFDKPDDEIDLAAFHGIPHHTQYVHLLSHLKLSTAYMEQIVVRLQREYPEFYNRLVQFSKSHNL